jgi:hypothetical protein
MRRGDTVGQERLTDQSVALIIKSHARTAHLPDELLPKLSGHSLRAGYATAAVGRRDRVAQDRERHPSQEHRRRPRRAAELAGEPRRGGQQVRKGSHK